MTDQKDLVRDMYRTVYENKEFDAVSDFYAADTVRHGGLQGSIQGRDALVGYLEASLGGLSDIEVTELHCLEEDDIVVFDYEMTATHSGPMLEVPATGNQVEMTNAALFRIDDGKIVDEWPRTDMLGLMDGIGAIELPF
jgi:C-1 hydroxylase